MGPIMVVPAPHISQRGLELLAVRERGSGQFPFHRADESFHSPVLPGTAGLGALMTDPQQPEAKPKEPRYKDGLIVGAYGCWSAVAFHRFGELTEEGEGRLLRELLQAQARAAPMIDDGQCQMWMPLLIRLHQQIAAPDPIAWHRAWHAVFQFAPSFIDQILVSPTGRGARPVPSRISGGYVGRESPKRVSGRRRACRTKDRDEVTSRTENEVPL